MSSSAPNRGGAGSTFTTLALDVGLPVGLYFLLHDALSMSIVLALTLSSIPPAIREVQAIVRERRINALAALMLATNVAGIVTSFITGDPRLILAKNSIISSVIAVAILVSVRGGEPIMSEGLQAFLVKGDTARAAAWMRLRERSADFARCERRYNVMWGMFLLADCVARLVGAFALPVSVMSWASTVILVVAIVAASLIAGARYAAPMQGMLDRELGDAPAPRPQTRLRPMSA